jgi:hypothetical protein
MFQQSPSWNSIERLIEFSHNNLCSASKLIVYLHYTSSCLIGGIPMYIEEKKKEERKVKDEEGGPLINQNIKRFWY